MALTSGTSQNIATVRSDAVDAVQHALVVFSMAGTYDQAANSSLVGVPTLIQNARRNGKTVNLIGATLGQTASKASSPSSFMALKTIAVAGADITFEITDGDYTTELAAGAIPAQARYFGLLVAFFES